MKLLVALAAAAAFGETAPTTLPGSSACLQATGSPAEVAASVDGGVQFFRAGANGFTAGPVIAAPGSCPVIRMRASGTGLIADNTERSVSVVLRDPGADWAPPVTLPAAEASDVTAAVSDRGDAVVAWLERSDDEGPYRTLVARRPAGGVFGAPELLASTPRQPEWLEAGIANSGEALVMLSSTITDRPPVRMAVQVAIGAPGAAFAAPVTVAEMPWRSRPALAVATDGRALVTLTDAASVLAAERPPGGVFGAPVVIGPKGADLIGVVTSAAIDHRGAAIAWRGRLQGEVRLATRRGPGAFSPAVTALRARRLDPDVDPFYFTEAVTFWDGLFPDRGKDTLSLTADGRALFAWVRGRGTDTRSASLATLPLGGTRAETHTRGGAITQVVNAVPVLLDGGTAALAYDARLEDVPHSSLQLAFAGARGAVRTAVPRVRVNPPHPRTVAPQTPVSVSLVCARACDARAVVVGEGRAQAQGMDRGGVKFSLGLVPAYQTWSAERTLRIRVTYGAPGSERVRSKVVTVTRRKVKPTRITGLSARRVGSTIRVRWRATRTPLDTTCFVAGTATRGATGEPLAFTPAAAFPGRPIRAAIRGAGVHWVTVRMRSRSGYTRATVRVP